MAGSCVYFPWIRRHQRAIAWGQCQIWCCQCWFQGDRSLHRHPCFFIDFTCWNKCNLTQSVTTSNRLHLLSFQHSLIGWREDHTWILEEPFLWNILCSMLDDVYTTHGWCVHNTWVWQCKLLEIASCPSYFSPCCFCSLEIDNCINLKFGTQFSWRKTTHAGADEESTRSKPSSGCLSSGRQTWEAGSYADSAWNVWEGSAGMFSIGSTCQVWFFLLYTIDLHANFHPTWTCLQLWQYIEKEKTWGDGRPLQSHCMRFDESTFSSSNLVLHTHTCISAAQLEV